jgi:hypothetical protein
LLHEALLSDLVVPVMLAQAPEHRSAARCAAHLAESTWLRPDLVVARREQFRPELGCVTGTPLLVVEVTSPASLDRDLGAKREMWARHGVPCYWVVRVSGEETHLHVFELQGDELVERARLTRGDTYWAHEPFKIELSPSALLQTVPAEMATTWRVKMSKKEKGRLLHAVADRCGEGRARGRLSGLLRGVGRQGCRDRRADLPRPDGAPRPARGAAGHPAGPAGAAEESRGAARFGGTSPYRRAHQDRHTGRRVTVT